jgi:hypothetical protein
MHPAEARKLPATNAVRSALVIALILSGLAQEIVAASAAEYCADSQSEIQTDRPDVTNSSFVVPNRSLQAENGINLTAHQASGSIDGTNTRIREFGWGSPIASSFLADLPDYFYFVHGGDAAGFSDLAPAVKAQLGPLPGGVVLSATAGLGFPTGAGRISGHVYNPHVQFPWSREIGGGWSLGGMFTQFWFPGQPESNAISEATFVVEREIGAHADLFTEYVGDLPKPQRPEPSHQLRWCLSVYRDSANRFSRRVRINQQIADLFLWLGLFGSI